MIIKRLVLVKLVFNQYAVLIWQVT